MSSLRIFKANDASAPIADVTDFDQIASHLHQHGVRFERWEASVPITGNENPDSILAAYDSSIQKLKQESGFATADVISLTPDHPDKIALRQKFLSEHTHSEDEVRFFVEGSGLFVMHIDDQVLHLVCTKEDLISVPAGTKHWFDMGPEPRFTCVRLFTNPDGWVANYTGDNIADKFPRFDQTK